MIANSSAPSPDSLSGLIERVTFHNDENGFAVLQVKAKGHRDLVTVVGSLASVSAGEWLTAEGRWVQDRELGLQFKAELLASTAPTTREGTEVETCSCRRFFGLRPSRIRCLFKRV